jgi:hypothetical protein
MENNKGFTLVAAIFIILVMTFLAITTSTFIASDAVLAVNNYRSLDAFYIASTGMEYYLKLLDDDDDWSTPPADKEKDFSGGCFVITTTDESRNRITFTVTGYLTLGATTYRRAVRPTVQRTAGGLGDILGEYVVYWGGSGGTGSTIGNNVTIIGDIFAGSDLVIGSNCDIDGDAQATGTIETGAGTEVSGTTESEAEPPYDPPSLETTYYDNKIAIAAGEPPGNWQLDTSTLSGSYYINGDVTMKNNASITITDIATIVATGKVIVSNNVTIGDFLRVIADGAIDIANNVDIGANGLWYSSDSIEVGNNAEAGDVNIGEGTIFITPGDVTFGNNIEYYGFLYCGGDFTQTGNNFYFEGNMIVGGDINVDNNTTLVLNDDLVEIEDLVGITTGSTEESFEVAEWDEVY